MAARLLMCEWRTLQPAAAKSATHTNHFELPAAVRSQEERTCIVSQFQTGYRFSQTCWSGNA